MNYHCEFCKERFALPTVIVVPVYGTNAYGEAEVCPYCGDPDIVNDADDRY